MSIALEPAAAPGTLRRRVAGIYAVLAVFNIGAWIWAFIAFHAQPLLLGTGLLAYGFGLRHAVDADHIAAIDNVTRKLMQDGRRPVSVGFFFALGHSAVVLLVAIAVAATAAALESRFEAWKDIGGVISTSVSALFLFLIAAMNIVILRGVWRAFGKVRRGERYDNDDLDLLLNSRGLLSRLFRPLFRLVSRPLWMLPLGFLFGLGFDTATEVSLLGISASQAAQGVSMGVVLVFPVLFAAGMSLVDTTDGILMLGAYDWAFVRPIRKLYYNLTITLVSVAVAVLIGGIETLGLLADHFDLKGGFWNVIGSLNDNFNNLGFVIIGVFIFAWVISFLIYRLKRYDELPALQSDR
ncbi:HoxN/HupN/NixA family nickel/cobalt transporter [Paraburkholderia tropica]|uniref:Nickel/cobalt efflux system n=1 Tax=Paraburkholderia tropica TaxID=92647 RepID=A0AAQ1GPM6_9BURK|nr:HoxN/HupN/NixA family nickel/cobalt transporter [Paraburkholderia tropica]MBB2979563.1 high-affinity nickel-transport protein [Paraburkholderia tropica]MBB3005230.1 high-affinity nickel-transport protein [Paraburkholderia tropica]MBB6324161.1 high-affinity nickel-transport protein [Paraburkholderia tropica]MDE1143951.1 HoxN/HupN/NixA family nickel/cobalt transporter [Paraburkholderia tropica]PXX04097.1 high-affinity nickel-transport protein [Paraburkholderia tropica]